MIGGIGYLLSLINGIVSFLFLIQLMNITRRNKFSPFVFGRFFCAFTHSVFWQELERFLKNISERIIDFFSTLLARFSSSICTLDCDLIC